MTIAKLRADLHDLSLKCDAAHAQAEVSQPYAQRYRDVQVNVRAWHDSIHVHQTRALDLKSKLQLYTLPEHANY